MDELRSSSFKFNSSQRDRLKDFPSYHAATVFKNIHLPLIFRQPFYDGGASYPVCNKPSEYQDGFLPPIMTQRKSKKGQGPLRDPLDKRSKVVSIPLVERKRKRRLLKLEAKGTKAKAFMKGNTHSSE